MSAGVSIIRSAPEPMNASACQDAARDDYGSAVHYFTEGQVSRPIIATGLEQDHAWGSRTSPFIHERQP